MNAIPVIETAKQLANLLIQLDQLKFIDPLRVMPLAQEALVLAEQVGATDSQAKALSYIAWSHTLEGDSASGVEQATRALLLAQEYGHLREEVRALGMLGAALLSVHLNDEAMACYQRAEQIATEHKYPDSMGLTLNDLGVIALHREQPEHALVLFERGLTMLSRTSGGGMARAILMLNLGSTYSQMGRHQEAETHLFRALEVVAAHPAGGVMAVIYTELGQDSFRQSHHAEAGKFYALALPMVETPSIPRLQIQIHTLWAKLERACGNFDAAIAHLEKARDIAQIHRHGHTLVAILDTLAELHTQIGSKLDSLDCDQDALKLRAALHEEEIEARLTILRSLYALRGRVDIPLDTADGGTSLDELLEVERERIERQKQHELAVFRDRVAHRIAHELRNPLAIIRSSGELLQQYSNQMTEDKRQQHLDQIMAGTQRMNVLITDILNLLDPVEDKGLPKP